MPEQPSPDLSAFPPGFRWSAATAAFQIEGGDVDGRGRSHQPATGAERRRDSVASRPSSSMDSNSGGEMCEPVTATRTGP